MPLKFLDRQFDVAFLSLGAFDPQVIDTETLEDGSKKFTFSMTIPTTDTFDTFRNYYKEVLGVFPEDDDNDYDEEGIKVNKPINTSVLDTKT